MNIIVIIRTEKRCMKKVERKKFAVFYNKKNGKVSPIKRGDGLCEKKTYRQK